MIQKVVPNLTAAKTGLQVGDIILSINGSTLNLPTVSKFFQGTATGTNLTIKINRGGKEVDLSGPLLEKPRDPGNANYEVIYSHVVAYGQRMRTIITKPRKGGKYPGFFFIQGFSPVSYDFDLETSDGSVQSLDGPILRDFANGGFVTIRVEKPGVGDSEGGPFNDLDYYQEIDIYKEALKQLKAMPEVDTNNVFIFGHSMGGSFGPMVAAENKVKGIAVYGTAGRTWFEYLMDTIRYQGLVGGQSFEDADDEARDGALIMSLVMLQNKSPEEVKTMYPEKKQLIDAYFPGGRFNGKALNFWRQLASINFAKYWAKCDARVLAVKGASDFVVYEADHKLIADLTNRIHPGWGKFEIVPDSDHLFHKFATEQESMRNWQKGTYSSNFSKRMMEWIREVIQQN